MKSWSIKRYILLLALLPGIIVSLALGSYFIFSHSHDLDRLLENRGLAIAKQLAPTCEYGVMSGNMGILQNIATSMLEEKDVRAVTIFNQDMNTLAHAGPKMLSERSLGPALHQELQLTYTDQSIRIRAPIYAQNLMISDFISETFYAEENTESALLGWAEIELSLSNTRLARYEFIASSLIAILVALLLCSLLTMRLVRRLTTPLGSILHTIRALEQGKLDARAHVSGRGELQQIASGINAMASALQRTDIEHQQNLEQATQDLQETLDELEIRNRELIIGRREAMEANRMKSEFLANVSHEIRTPLNGIIGFSDLLLRTKLNDHQSDYLSTIRRSSNDLLTIINDILDLSKIDAGKLIIEHTQFYLRDALEEVLTVLAPTAAAKNIELQHLIYSDVPQLINGDSLRIKQVLSNLINNAIKFTEQGSVNIRVSLTRKLAEHSIIHFEIIDTGIGIAEEHLSKLFTPFNQGDASTARRFGGTGLGLMISNALVKAMNGSISVTSKEGFGSTFSFTIEVEHCEHNAQTGITFSDKRIALLEPSFTNRINLGTMFDQWQLPHDDFESSSALLNALPTAENCYWDAFVIMLNSRALMQDTHKRLIARLQATQRPILILSDNLDQVQQQSKQLIENCMVLAYPYPRARLYQHLCNAFNLTLPTLTPNTHNVKAPCVLAVDDNPANLKLVTTLLKDLNLPVLQASSGIEAIELVAQNAIDLVLMDIQMPIMNGLEATQRIRQLPGKASLPIIALTAHAMADEKEALLRAGMNDYQIKPISQQQLASCIEHWTHYQCTQEISLTSQSKQAEAAEKDQLFDVKQALHLAHNNVDLARDMFQMLLESLPKDLSAMREAWEEENFVQLGESAHRALGATRYSGVPTLQSLLEHIETSIKRQQHGELPQRMRELMHEFERLTAWACQHDWQADLIAQAQASIDAPANA